MSVGPLRRIAAGVGLVALVPIAMMVATGELAPEDAALRASVVAGLVLVLGNLTRAILTRLLQRFERRAGHRDGEGDPAEGRLDQKLSVAD